MQGGGSHYERRPSEKSTKKSARILEDGWGAERMSRGSRELKEAQNADVQLYEARGVPSETALGTVWVTYVELPSLVRGVQGRLAGV